MPKTPKTRSKKTEKTPPRSDVSGITDIKQPFPEEWKPQIIQIVRQEIEAMMESQAVPNCQINHLEPPPFPGKERGDKGRPVGKVKRPKIAGTVYEPILRAFEKWRTDRGLSLSTALDTALWHFLGKPPLSSELSETSDDEESA